MDPSKPNGCRHPDIRTFDDLRCCMSCGFALPSRRATSTSASSDNPAEHNSSSDCHYRQLNYELGQEIRLIRLKSGSYSEPLVCEIVHANLLDNPRYEALSYTWADKNGDDSLSCHILCATGGCTINITANCDAALRRLRHQTMTKTIWVDSICIEQSNIQERNHQVRQMGNIYSSAEQVLVYLGEESFDSKDIFQYLEKAIIIRQHKSVVIEFSRDQETPHPMTMARFFSRRWFHRIWVLQEVGLARKATVLCGEQSLDWAFFNVDRLMEGGLSSQTYGEITPSPLLLESKLYKGNPGLLDLLEAARNAECKDPRDNVYAILNLVSEDKRYGIQPDYAKSLDWLFTHVAVQIMSDDKSLNLLSYAKANNSLRFLTRAPAAQENTSVHGLPSWVPNWTISTKEEPLRDQFKKEELEFMSRWKSQDRMNHNSAPLLTSDEVRSAGLGMERYYHDKKFHFDVVWDVHSDALPPRITVRGHHLGHVSTILRLDRYSAGFVNTSQCCHKEGAFWMNLKGAAWLAGWRNGWVESPNYIAVPPAFGELCNSCKTQCAFHVHYSHEDMSTFIKQIQLFSRGRIFFATSYSLGLGPTDMTEGDGVWLLDTMEVALILRKIESHYFVIGECHLHRALTIDRGCSTCGREVESNLISTEEIEIW